MKLKVVVHEPEECGFWAEVPAVPGLSAPPQGENFTPAARWSISVVRWTGELE